MMTPALYHYSTIQVDNAAAAAGESYSAFGISRSILHSQNNIIPMLEKYFKKEMEIWGVFTRYRTVFKNKLLTKVNAQTNKWRHKNRYVKRLSHL